jgi:protein-L-isoaspartate(D-aspartate) O-methyltransferase
MHRLTGDLIKKGYLKSDLIIKAFSEIGRTEFVPDELKSQAEEDVPLPIGYGQTISQPLTVAFMLELLNLQRGQNVLDIGSGSGWTTALLSHVVGPKGKIFAIERIPELCKWGKSNADKFKFVRKGIAEFYCAGGSEVCEKNAPYDRILVSAMAQEMPKAFRDQLKIGGRMVIPMRGSIWLLEKKGENDFYEEEYPGFSFVPLITDSGE